MGHKPAGTSRLVDESVIAAFRQRIAAGDTASAVARQWILQQADVAVRRRSASKPVLRLESTALVHDLLFSAGAYRITEEPSYRDFAAQGLASLGESWDSNDPFVRDNDSLDFSVFMVSLVYTYDLLRPALSDKEAERLEEGWFAPAAEAIQKNAYGGSDRHFRSNHRTWQNTAVGLLGFASGRKDLVEWAIRNPEAGFLRQLEISFGKDGIQWEGSPRYQLYTLAAFIALAEGAEQAGIGSLWKARGANGNDLSALLTGLLQIAETNMRLPNVNARRQENLDDFGSIFRLAYARTGNPDFGWVAARAKKNPPDRSWTYPLELLAALLPPPPTSLAAPRLLSAVRDDIRWATLRAGNGALMGADDPLYVLFKYGRFRDVQGPGAAHDHPDKGLLEVRASGQQWLAARVRQETDDPLYAGFDRQTVAKNTLVVDETSQPGGKGPFDAEGTSGLLVFSDLQPFVKVVRANLAPVYGMPATRTVALIGEGGDSPYVLDLFEVQADRPHRFDYVLRAGEPDYVFTPSDLAVTEVPSWSNVLGYKELRQIHSGPLRASSTFGWKTPSGQGVAINPLGTGPSTVFESRAPGLTDSTSFAHLILRQTAPAVAFHTVIEPYRLAPQLRAHHLHADRPADGLVVQGSNFRDWFVAASGSPVESTDGDARVKIGSSGYAFFARERRHALD